VEGAHRRQSQCSWRQVSHLSDAWFVSRIVSAENVTLRVKAQKFVCNGELGMVRRYTIAVAYFNILSQLVQRRNQCSIVL
jgi:hypothetical protein